MKEGWHVDSNKSSNQKKVQKFMVARVVICVYTTQTMHLYIQTLIKDTLKTLWYLTQSSQPSTGFPFLNSLTFIFKQPKRSLVLREALATCKSWWLLPISYVAVFAQVKIFSPVLKLVDIDNSHTKELLNYAASVEGIVG